MAAHFPFALSDDTGSWSIGQWIGVIALAIIGAVLLTGALLAALFGGVEGFVLVVVAFIVVWMAGHYVWTEWLAPLFGVS